jgi:hypothetical protein
MSGDAAVPVASDEWLARFILFRNHIRQDGSVRPDAFIPHPYPDLSVTRHLGLPGARLWQLGQNVASQRQRTLLGRADVQCHVFQRLRLRVAPAPVPENPNHANVSAWPADKPAQKILAQEISAAAGRALITPPGIDI